MGEGSEHVGATGVGLEYFGVVGEGTELVGGVALWVVRCGVVGKGLEGKGDVCKSWFLLVILVI